MESQFEEIAPYLNISKTVVCARWKRLVPASWLMDGHHEVHLVAEVFICILVLLRFHYIMLLIDNNTDRLSRRSVCMSYYSLCDNWIHDFRPLTSTRSFSLLRKYMFNKKCQTTSSSTFMLSQICVNLC